MFFAVEKMSAAYGRLEVLHEISLAVNSGEVVTLIGANGAGKSTTLLAISGLVPKTAGRVLLGAHDITASEPHTIVALGIIHVPEGRRIFPRLTVEENLEMGAYSLSGGPDASTFDYVYQLFPILAERRRQPGGTLSGGEQQMLAIGRGFMAHRTGKPARLLLLDEPSLGIAPQLVEKIFDALQAWIKETHVPILLVEQNAQLALEISDRAYVLETGRIVLEGSGHDLKNNEEVKRAYLGV